MRSIFKYFYYSLLHRRGLFRRRTTSSFPHLPIHVGKLFLRGARQVFPFLFYLAICPVCHPAYFVGYVIPNFVLSLIGCRICKLRLQNIQIFMHLAGQRVYFRHSKVQFSFFLLFLSCNAVHFVRLSRIRALSNLRLNVLTHG